MNALTTSARVNGSLFISFELYNDDYYKKEIPKALLEGVLLSPLLSWGVSRLTGIGNPKGAAIASAVNTVVSSAFAALYALVNPYPTPFIYMVPFVLLPGFAVAKMVTKKMGCEVGIKDQLKIAALTMVPLVAQSLPILPIIAVDVYRAL